MAEVSLTDGSWLNLTNLLEFNGIVFWDQTLYPDIPFSPNDVFIQLTTDQASRVDLIAFDAYGDAELFWIILLANNVDYPNQLIEGQTIRIPSQKTVDTILSVNSSTN